MRRGIQQGRVLGTTKPFFYKLVEDVAALMGRAYPELNDGGLRASALTEAEEHRFSRTLDAALVELNEYSLEAVRSAYGQNIRKIHQLGSQSEGPSIAEMIASPPEEAKGEVIRRAAMFLRDRVGAPVIFSGRRAFYLFDTLGLPKDFIEDAPSGSRPRA